MSTQPIYLHQTDRSLLTLESVILDFLNWRRDPHRKRRIPESLWVKVIALLSRHTKSKVLSKLGISGAQLAQKLKERGVNNTDAQSADIAAASTAVTPAPIIQRTQSQPEQSIDTSSFIKAVMPTSIRENTVDVVLTKPNGASMHIQKLSCADLWKLTTSFIG